MKALRYFETLEHPITRHHIPEHALGSHNLLDWDDSFCYCSQLKHVSIVSLSMASITVCLNECRLLYDKAAVLRDTLYNVVIIIIVIIIIIIIIMCYQYEILRRAFSGSQAFQCGQT